MFKERFPVRQDVVVLYAFTTTLLHIWSFVNVFRAVSAWSYMMTISEMVGSVAYTLLPVFAESILIVSGLVMLALILPEKVFKARFVSQGAVIVLAVVIRVIFFHIQGGGVTLEKLIRWTVDLSVVILVFSLIVGFMGKAQIFIRSLVERFLVLGWIFLILDIVGVLIVLWRNFLG